MEKTTTNIAVYTDDDSAGVNDMNISSPSHTVTQPASSLHNGGVSNNNGDLVNSDKSDAYIEKTPSETESISKQKTEEDDQIVELEDKQYDETVHIEEQDFHANKNDISSTDQPNDIDERSYKEADDTSSSGSLITSDHYKDNVISVTNKEKSEPENDIDETSNHELETKADDTSSIALLQASDTKTDEVIDEINKTQCDVESVSDCIPESNENEADVILVAIENESEETVLNDKQINLDEGSEVVIDNETGVILRIQSPSSEVEGGSLLDVLSMGSSKSKESGPVLNTEPTSKTDPNDVSGVEKDLDIESLILPDDTADPSLEKTDLKKEETSEKGQNLGGNNKGQNSSRKPIKSNKSSDGNGVIKVKPIKDRKISTVQPKFTGKKLSTPRISTSKKDDQKVILPRETKASLARKIGIDHTKDKPTFIQSTKDTKLTKHSIIDKTSEKPSQNQYIKDSKLQKSSVSDKTSERPSQTQFIRDTKLQTSPVTDKTSEKLVQSESTTDTKLQASEDTDKTSVLENQEAEEPKNQQVNDKDVTEKKPASLQTDKNSDVENTLSTQVYDTEVKKVETKTTKDQNNVSKSTFTKVNETENKKSPKVKWSEKVKVTLQSKNTGKQLPNGNLNLKGTNQEKDKHVKTQPIKQNEKLSAADEKGKSMEPIVEGEETSNEKDNEKFNPKSILAKAAWNKGVKDKSGQGSVAQNGPTFLATKTKSKSSLAVHSGSTGEDKEDKLSVGSRRDSTMLSLDSVSHKSIDYRNTSTVVNPVTEDKPGSLLNNNDSWIRSAIPYQPLSLSILCLFLNTLLPGTGTILSGLSILCCGKTRVTTKDDHVSVTVCVNVWVGVAQLFTITFCLVGWFWSIAWGIKMVILSVEYRRELKAKREKELQAMALSAFGSPSRGRALFPGMA